MNNINPHAFSAILDGISHRFILIQEFECLHVTVSSGSRNPHRFTIGGHYALMDPRTCKHNDLVEIAVGNKLLFDIPFRKFHVCIYILLTNCIN